MPRRAVALGTVALCVLATGLAAAGLPAVSVEPVDDGAPIESENSSLGSGGGSSSGSDNVTYRMQGQDGELNATQSMIAQLMASASSAVPGGLSGGDSESDGADAQDRTSLLTVSEAVFGVVALVLVAAVVTLRSVSGSTDETDDEAEGDEDRDAAAAAAAAGRAADAVADAEGDESDLSNAVYRAWYEMTAALDVADPETATPGEFADAARETGLDPDAVADLTTVFEAVRYGDEPAADYEDRALAALRRIERDTGGGADGHADRTARSGGFDAGSAGGSDR